MMRDTLVLLVDGDCTMCNWCVQFIAERDHAGVVYFETQQSGTGQRLLEKYKQPQDLSTVVLIEKIDGRAHAACYTKSSAMLRVAGRLGCPWSALSHLTFIPRFIRDGAYDCVAYSRYAVFGKTEGWGRQGGAGAGDVVIASEPRGAMGDDGEEEVSLVERIMRERKAKAAEKQKQEEEEAATRAAEEEAAAQKAREDERQEAKKARILARAPATVDDLFELYNRRVAGDKAAWGRSTLKDDDDDDRGVVVSPLTTVPHPRPRFNHATGADNEHGYLFGGVCLDGHTPFYLNDFWRWSLRDMMWERVDSLNAPTSRCGHSMVIRGDRIMLLFGGICANGELNDTHMLDLCLGALAWKKLHVGNCPPRRTGHSAALYKEQYMVVFGGKGPQVQLNDVWVLHYAARAWVEIKTACAPDPRWCHTAMVVDGYMYAFGGSAQAGKDMVDKNDVYTLRLQDLLTQCDDKIDAAKRRRKVRAIRVVDTVPEWELLAPTGPAPRPRRSHAMAPFNNGFVVYGGVSTTDAKARVLDHEIGDVFTFDVQKRQWSAVGAPRGYRRWGHSMFTFDGVQMYVTGGASSVAPQATLQGTLHFDFLSVAGAKPRQVFHVVNAGNSFTIEVARHHSQGRYDYGALDHKMTKHHEDYENALLEQRHGEGAVFTPVNRTVLTPQNIHILELLTKPAEHSLPERFKSAAIGLAQRAKENLTKAKAPCKQCFGPLDCVAIPCGHASLCVACTVASNDGIAPTCPVCRQPTEGIERLFAPAYGRLRDRVVLATVSPPPHLRSQNTHASTSAQATAKSGKAAKAAQRRGPERRWHLSTIDTGVMGCPMLRVPQGQGHHHHHGAQRVFAPVPTRRSLWCPQGVL